MKKIHLIVLLALLATGFILVSSSKHFETSSKPATPEKLSASLPKLSSSLFETLGLNLRQNTLTKEMAWQTFLAYLQTLKEKDFETFLKLSHQVSPTCANPELRTECEELMDLVYEFGQTLAQEDFKHIASDERQAILYTDYLALEDGWLERRAIYFTRVGVLTKVLGIKACYTQDPLLADDCINLDAETRDQNQNGWWDNLEALFYSN